MKKCTNCGGIYKDGDTCPSCGYKLSEYSGESKATIEGWEYAAAVLIPLIGLILGFIQVGKDNKEGGKRLITIAVVCMIIYAIIYSAARG